MEYPDHISVIAISVAALIGLVAVMLIAISYEAETERTLAYGIATLGAKYCNDTDFQTWLDLLIRRYQACRVFHYHDGL